MFSPEDFEKHEPLEAHGPAGERLGGKQDSRARRNNGCFVSHVDAVVDLSQRGHGADVSAARRNRRRMSDLVAKARPTKLSNCVEEFFSQMPYQHAHIHSVRMCTCLQFLSCRSILQCQQGLAFFSPCKGTHSKKLLWLDWEGYIFGVCQTSPRASHITLSTWRTQCNGSLRSRQHALQQHTVFGGIDACTRFEMETRTCLDRRPAVAGKKLGWWATSRGTVDGSAEAMDGTEERCKARSKGIDCGKKDAGKTRSARKGDSEELQRRTPMEQPGTVLET